MEPQTLKRHLPSCTLNRAILTGIERRLLLGIPKLLGQGLRKVLLGLGIDSHKKFEKYQVIVERGKKTQLLNSAEDLPNAYFESGTHRVRLIYKLGGPKIIVAEIFFAQNEQPWIELTTHSPQIATLLPKIADGLIDIIAPYRNRHKVLQNRFVQTGLMLLVPFLVMAYGAFRGIDLFLLYASMGWLCLLLLGIVTCLPRLFPWVTFQTKRHFQWKHLPPMVTIFGLILAIICYIGLILHNIPAAQENPVVMLAALIG